MEFTNNQIKCILRIKEFVETSNTLSKLYKEFDDKELTLLNITDQERLYKVYCSSIYNLIKAIKESKDLFGSCKKYNEFDIFINKEYLATNDKYFDDPDYKSNFYKIIKTIRHQINHFNRDDENDNVLFEIYIDFNVVEELRLIINDIFYEVYNKLDKKKINKIYLAKPVINYSFEKVSDEINKAEQVFNEIKTNVDKSIVETNKELIDSLREYFNPSDILNLLNGDDDTIEKYELMDDKIDNLFIKETEYIEENGNQFHKDAMDLINFISNDDGPITKNELEKKKEDIKKRLIELAEKYDKKN